MKTYNNELVIKRNETFTLDKLIQNRDGSPYIVSANLANPHFLITISDTTYDVEKRMVIKLWLPITFPRFISTVPVNIRDFKQTPDGDVSWYDSFDDLTGLPSGYLGNNLVTYTDGNEAVFYLDTANGRVYKYWDEINGKWMDYECRLTCRFEQSLTKLLLEKSYLYTIELVSGLSLMNWLEETCKIYSIAPSDSALYMYEALMAKNPELVKDVNLDLPLMNFDLVVPILESTKFTVLSNLKGVM
jgi:hypothetical protein